MLQQKSDVLEKGKQSEETFKMGMGHDYFLQIVVNINDNKITGEPSTSQERTEEYFSQLQKKSEKSVIHPSKTYVREYSGKLSEKQPTVQYETLAEVLSNIFKNIRCEIYYILRKYSKLTTSLAEVIPEMINNDVAITHAEQKGFIAEE